MTRQLPWMKDLRAGDVLRKKDNTRVVRKVSRNRDGSLRYVYFAIQRCSWTTRPYTLVSHHELINQGYEKVEGFRHEFRTKLDRKLQHDVNNLGLAPKRWRTSRSECCELDCCDVHGVA